MKHVLIGLLSGLTLAAAHADIVVPGANGSDGALTVAASTTIDLSQAAAGQWDSVSPTAGKGVYDVDKWAVVFHYTSVNLSGTATLAFLNHPSHAPVVWLVNGDVTIGSAAVINLGSGSPGGVEPRPGGFRGLTNTGLGPGGATASGFGASFAATGTGTNNPAKPYSNSQIIPLIGGSGAVGIGGAGGILIAATGTITVNGVIRANGVSGASGGAIRLVANHMAGTGSLSAIPVGRIRLETATTVDPPLANNVSPVASIAHPANPSLLWPPDPAASARIVSIGTESVATDPKALLGNAADTLPDAIGSSIPVAIETKNVPITSVVNLRIAPPTGAATLVPATYVSGDVNTAEWTVNVTPASGSTVLQVRVEAP